MRRLLSWPQLFRRPSCNFLERAVELRDGSKAYFQSDGADAKVWVLQKILRFLDPHAPQVFDKVHPRCFLESLDNECSAIAKRRRNLPGSFQRGGNMVLTAALGLRLPILSSSGAPQSIDH